ncbi:MAG: AAA family ATPase [Candidatus Methanomethylophilaceae archaeon]|nr:AAA family ATPase [Candidatus Methanomethylophilaceae archaeon]
MKLIITTGMPGAGKEEFMLAASDSGIPFLRMGDIVREFHAKRDEKDKDLSVGQLANLDRQRYGFDIWAKRAMEKMSGDIFMIDGCRSMDEVRAYRNLTDDVNIVAIFASPKTRYDRLVKRAREDAPKNIDEFNERDNRELGWGLGETMALADRMIINESSLDDFKKAVKELMEDFRR